MEGAHGGIIAVDLFERVQAKLPRLKPGKRPFRPKRNADFPLAGLMVCGHCGEPMYATVHRSGDRKGRKVYTYRWFVCSSYMKEVYGSTCGRHPIAADLVTGWLVAKLQEIYLGPGRDALVAEIRKQLKAAPKTSKRDVGRLEKRLGELDREVSRLVKAVRMSDIAELVEELSLVQAERERVKAELGDKPARDKIGGNRVPAKWNRRPPSCTRSTRTTGRVTFCPFRSPLRWTVAYIGSPQWPQEPSTRPRESQRCAWGERGVCRALGAEERVFRLDPLEKVNRDDPPVGALHRNDVLLGLPAVVPLAVGRNDFITLGDVVLARRFSARLSHSDEGPLP